MQKRVSVKDIAEEMNISLSTVHKALTGKPGISEKRRREVIDTAKRMNYTVNPIAQSLARKDIKIGVVMPKGWQGYFQTLKSGMEKEMLALEKYKVQGKFYFFSNDISGKEGEKLLGWLKKSEIDVLIYCPSIYSIEEEVFFSIKKLGIPVFFADDSYDNSFGISTISIDAEMSGKLAADFLCCIHPTDLRVAVFTGSLKLKPHKIKTNAFGERIHKFGGEIVGIFETNDDDLKASECMDEIMKQGVNAVYVSTATSLSVCKYFESHKIKDKVALVCTDLYDELKYYLKENIVKATVYQNQEKVGRQVVRVAYDYFVSKNSFGGELLEFKSRISVKPRLCLLADIE